ncbi:uncharacterized protein HD556DRAFT_1313609 [Suillus plorans]|uniref:Uncharacterized protein n=1 Tax=Suillus plorans TaxID=116603 RepID=A0A9P7ACV8_9AGAM|nr:uncharacterized protein HD556DRAFT_1313609 [Suillus plorans]KAG1786260.1 hypothetical protein HD556DRAFT_1313609 [Suillus plorans]
MEVIEKLKQDEIEARFLGRCKPQAQFQKPRPKPAASAFHNVRPGQSRHQAVTLAQLGLAYSGPAWPGPRPEAGPEFEWELIWKDQVHEQVLHAFEADRTLKYLGVIIAAGCHWVYGTVNRGNLLPQTMSEQRDPNFRGTRSPASSSDDSTVEERETQSSFPSLDIPNFLPKTENGAFYKFDLLDILDARGVSLRVFEGILDDLRRKNSDIWF